MPPGVLGGCSIASQPVPQARRAEERKRRGSKLMRPVAAIVECCWWARSLSARGQGSPDAAPTVARVHWPPWERSKVSYTQVDRRWVEGHSGNSWRVAAMRPPSMPTALHAIK